MLPILSRSYLTRHHATSFEAFYRACRLAAIKRLVDVHYLRVPVGVEGHWRSMSLLHTVKMATEVSGDPFKVQASRERCCPPQSHAPTVRSLRVAIADHLFSTACRHRRLRRSLT